MIPPCYHFISPEPHDTGLKSTLDQTRIYFACNNGQLPSQFILQAVISKEKPINQTGLSCLLNGLYRLFTRSAAFRKIRGNSNPVNINNSEQVTDPHRHSNCRSPGRKNARLVKDGVAFQWLQMEQGLRPVLDIFNAIHGQKHLSQQATIVSQRFRPRVSPPEYC